MATDIKQLEGIDTSQIDVAWGARISALIGEAIEAQLRDEFKLLTSQIHLSGFTTKGEPLAVTLYVSDVPDEPGDINIGPNTFMRINVQRKNKKGELAWFIL